MKDDYEQGLTEVAAKLRRTNAGTAAFVLRARHELSRLRSELEELKRFSAAHHSDQQAHVFLHALTVDIPARIDTILDESTEQ